MGWGSFAICDYHWFQSNPRRKPVRVIGDREHCHINGCDRTGDIFVRAFLPKEEEVMTTTTNFVNADHALATGMLAAAMMAGDAVPIEIETDKDGSYRPSLLVAIAFGDTNIMLRLSVYMVDQS